MNNTERIAEIRERCNELRKIGFAGDSVAITASKLFAFVDVSVPQLFFHINELTAELEQKTREVERYRDIWSANYLGTPYDVDGQSPTQSMPEDMRDRFRESYSGQRFDAEQAALSAEGVSG